ncbi:uncharacterized protein [Euphorbia lathyris]|uniref:uncharacterized protein n=1 Tax=Euphorbia lathyris TaxID=212925 RepID=UPI0033133CAC
MATGSIDPKNLNSTVQENGRRIDELEKEILKLRKKIGKMNKARAKVAQQSESLTAVMANVNLFQAFIAKADVMRAVIDHTGLFEFIMANAEAIRGTIAKKTSPRSQAMEEGGDTSKLPETINRLEAAHKSLFESVDKIHWGTIDELGTIKGELEEVKKKVDLLAQSGLRTRETAKFKIRVPKPYGGNRDANEVDNFLFDLEHYFVATRVSLDSERLVVVPMYLEGDAKLWWRHKAGLGTVNTWYDFKKNLKVQFSPENVAFTARCKLNKLQQTGSIREYVQAFQAIALDLPQMHEEERFFNFMNGLKPGVRDELTRREVKDHISAIVTAESLESVYNLPENTVKRKFPSNFLETRPNKLAKPLRLGGEQNNFSSWSEKQTWNVGNSEQRPFDGNNAERKNSQTTVIGSNIQSTKMSWNVGNPGQRPFDGNNAETKYAQTIVPRSSVQPTKTLGAWNVGNSEQKPIDGNNAERQKFSNRAWVQCSTGKDVRAVGCWNL